MTDPTLPTAGSEAVEVRMDDSIRSTSGPGALQYFSSLNSMVVLPHDIFPDVPEHRNENPFEQVSFSCWDWFCIIFHLLSGLFIVKLVLLFLFLFLMWFMCFLATCCSELEPDGYLNKPYGCFQKAAIAVGAFLARMILVLFGIFWIDCEWKGDSYEQHKQRKHGIMVINHITIWDALCVFWVVGGGSAVGKKELYSLPLIGRICQALRIIPADRYTKEGKQKTLERIEDRAKNPSMPLLIFPQGTCGPQKMLTKFKWGAFKDGHPVTPATVQYSDHFAHVQHWCSMERGLFHALCRFYTSCTVHILPRYEPSEAEIKNPIDYTNNVRKIIKDDLGPDCQLSEYCYDDYIFQKHVRDVRQDGDLTLDSEAARFSVRNICMDDLKTSFHLKTKDILEVATQFSHADKTGHGFLNFEELCDTLGMEYENKFSKRLFRILDRKKQREVGFVEMLGLLTACQSPDHANEAVDIMYELLAQKDGSVLLETFDLYRKTYPTKELDYEAIQERWFGAKQTLSDEEWEAVMENHQGEAQRMLLRSIFSKSTIKLNRGLSI